MAKHQRDRKAKIQIDDGKRKPAHESWKRSAMLAFNENFGDDWLASVRKGEMSAVEFCLNRVLYAEAAISVFRDIREDALATLSGD